MAMWDGSDPAAWCERYNNGNLKHKYAFFSPTPEWGKSTGVTAISFPQFEGESNLDPEGFQIRGPMLRLTISFRIINADVDMSRGSPGSIQTMEEQIAHLRDNISKGNLMDEFRVYIPHWFGLANYMTMMLEEISVADSGPMEASATARFVQAENPLA